MYTSMCVYLHFVALFTAATAFQQFWNEDEFCRVLNSELVRKQNSSNAAATNANITCIKSNDLQSNRGDTVMLSNVRLLCREFDSLTYVWNSSKNAAAVVDHVLIIVEFISYSSDEIHMIKEVNSSYVRFDNLMSNTEYKARFRTMIDGTTNHEIDTQIQKTLDKTLVPGPVNDIQISEFTTRKTILQTSLTWKFSQDKNCNYEIYYYPNNAMVSPKTFYIDVVKSNSYPFPLIRLVAKLNYIVSIRAFYRKTSPAISGNDTKYEFMTPSCLPDFDTNKCIVLGRPYNVTVHETSELGGGRYDATVSWRSLANVGVVERFLVKLGEEARNVSGTAAEVRFANVSLGDHYMASVQAFSRAGQSDETVVLEPRRRRVGGRTVARDDGGRAASHYPWTVALALSAFCGAAVAIGRRACRRTAGDKAAADENVLAALRDLDDVMLNRNDIVLSDVFLGHGNFGEVRKATLKTRGRQCPVAVKSLRDRPTVRDTQQFLREILLMQKVGKHPNIVSMIGCYLDANKRCMLVVEYCPLGDLQTYLKKVSIKSWYVNDFIVDRMFMTEPSTTANGKEAEYILQDTDNGPTPTNTASPPPMFFNNCYLYHSEENVFLTVDDLMHFASQAANGMVFLEQNHIVHRDLAARNLLLSDCHTIKICDFGLSRDVYEQNLYQKSNLGDPLPIKWMALESLKYRVYTSQSDVWSFGVLLWEIMMLGGVPYQTIILSRIYEVLRRGYRLPRPTLCCYRLYEVMLACWQPNPTDRPKFATIKDTIDNIIENQYS